MINARFALKTTLLLVEDDIDQLGLRALILRMSGFTVLSASNPVEAVTIMTQGAGDAVSIAILDYDMPVMNGCVLAEYLRGRYPNMKIILYSAADVLESERSSVDVLVPKSEGIAFLLSQIAEFAEVCATGMTTGARDLPRYAQTSF